jgi:hypothetical protein
MYRKKIYFFPDNPGGKQFVDLYSEGFASIVKLFNFQGKFLFVTIDSYFLFYIICICGQ